MRDLPSTEITSRLELKSIAAIFRETLTHPFRQLLRGATEFETPTDTAFSALEDDNPHFAVVGLLPLSRFAPDVVALHLYCWDRGSEREIQVFARGGFVAVGVIGTWKQRDFVNAIRASDASARIRGHLSDVG